MRHLSTALLTLALAVSLPSASAAVLLNDGMAVDTPQQENVYAMGGTVHVTAPVQGDVVAFAGDVIIEAPVSGDILAAGGLLHVKANVDGDIRAATSNLVVESGHVGGDIVYIGSQIAIGPEATASGAILAQSAQAIVQGKTSELVNLSASTITFGGEHQGPVFLTSDLLQFSGNTKVAGEVTYSASNVTDASALSAGSIKTPSVEQTSWLDTTMQFLFVAVFVAAMSLILAAMLMLVNPVWALSVTMRMRRNVGSSMFLGVFTVFALPSFLGFLLSMQVVFAPWAAVLLPFFFSLASVYVLLLALSLGMVAILAARSFPMIKGKSLNIWIALPLGALLTGVIVALPAVGLFALILLVCTAVGAMVQTDRAYLGVIPKKKLEK